MVADFWEDAKTPASISSFHEDSPAGALRDALTTQHPQIKVRLVLATSTSGVGGGKRKEVCIHYMHYLYLKAISRLDS